MCAVCLAGSGGGSAEKSVSEERDSSDGMNPSQVHTHHHPDSHHQDGHTWNQINLGHGLRVFGKCLQHLAWLVHLLWWPPDVLSSLSAHYAPRQSSLGWLADPRLQGPSSSSSRTGRGVGALKFNSVPHCILGSLLPEAVAG